VCFNSWYERVCVCVCDTVGCVTRRTSTLTAWDCCPCDLHARTVLPKTTKFGTMAPRGTAKI